MSTHPLPVNFDICSYSPGFMSQTSHCHKLHVTSFVLLFIHVCKDLLTRSDTCTFFWPVYGATKSVLISCIINSYKDHLWYTCTCKILTNICSSFLSGKLHIANCFPPSLPPSFLPPSLPLPSPSLPPSLPPVQSSHFGRSLTLWFPMSSKCNSESSETRNRTSGSAGYVPPFASSLTYLLTIL